MTLSRGPVENGHRPAVDVLFRSAALVLGPQVIGLVLSGALDDGTAGLAAIRSRGGIGVVQDPDEALHPSMPRCAIEGAAPEHVVRVADMPELLVRLAEEEVDVAPSQPPSLLTDQACSMGGPAKPRSEASLTRDMSSRAANRGHRRTAQMFDTQYREALISARLVRELMTVITSELVGLEQQTETGQA